MSCISRPRRFGKSYAAKMLYAYYDCSCDSHALFCDKEIARSPEYLKHLNQYHVISIDVAGFVSLVKKQNKAVGNVPELIEKRIYEELVSLYPEFGSESYLTDCLIRCVEKTGRQFVFIIDEWDAPIREAKEDANAQMAYLNLLREWFKNNNFTPQVVAAAYMTGILPIKKDGSQSAISDFREYTILNPGRFVEFTGFTEGEVQLLCEKYGMDFTEVRRWYDGYDFPGYGAIYNPYSVMCAMEAQECCSYWKKTSAAESLMAYINMDFEGLQETIARLISGEEIEVRTDRFENDFETFKSKDDVLTLLIHLGYLTWHTEEGHSTEKGYFRKDGTAHIPNEEVRGEFEKILEGTEVNPKWMELISRSRELLEDTIAGNEEAVVKAIEEIRDTQYAPMFYNDEQALRYVIKFAYIAAVDQYLKVEELPSGKGIADVVYLPKRKSMLPALVIELKWNKSSDGALAQIKERNYPAVLKDYGGEVVIVGISYDAKKKEHSCVIERA